MAVFKNRTVNQCTKCGYRMHMTIGIKPRERCPVCRCKMERVSEPVPEKGAK